MVINPALIKLRIIPKKLPKKLTNKPINKAKDKLNKGILKNTPNTTKKIYKNIRFLTKKSRFVYTSITIVLQILEIL